MSEEHDVTRWMMGGLGFIGTVIGVASWHKSRTDRELMATIHRQEILTALDRILQVQTRLSDVLEHPDDSGFGVGDIEKSINTLRENQIKIFEKLEKLEENKT